jgi:O-antigen ligase
MPSVGSVAARRLPAFDADVWVTMFLVVALLAPLIVVPGTFFPYVVPRNIVFRIAVELAAGIRIAEVILGGKRFDLRREYVLLALTGFLFAITISAMFSPARAHSFFGDFERMGGVWAWAHLAGFFLVLRSVREIHLTWLFHIALVSGVVASLHAVASFTDTSTRSVVGNSGLLAGYLLVSLSIALFLAATRGKYRFVYLLAAAIELWAMLVTQNRSSILGAVIGAAVATVLLGMLNTRRRTRWVPALIAVGLGATVLAVAAVRSGSDNRLLSVAPPAFRRIAETNLDGPDAVRGFQWDAAIAGFRERPVFGFGPENHHLVWSAHFDPRSEQIGIDVFDRTHNQYLEILATTGIIGTVAFIAIWAAIGYSLCLALSGGRLSVGEFAVLAGGHVAYAAYLLFWFVDINAAIVWMLLTALIAARSNPLPVLRESGRQLSRPIAVAGVIISGTALAVLLHRHAYVPLRANVALATLDSYSGNGEFPTAAVETIATSPARQTSHFGPVLSRFVQTWRSDRGDDAMGSDAESEKVNRAFQAAISEFDEELERDPRNDRLHTAAAQLLIEAAGFYDSPKYLARAITLLTKAVELNPGRSRQRLLLADALADFSTLGAGSGK